MIKLINDLVIDVSDLNYTLKKYEGNEKDEKTGEYKDVYTIKGYYSSLESAIKGAIEYSIKSKFKDNTFSLKEALKEIEIIHNKFNNINIIGGLEDE